MHKPARKVFLALSGGVDSAVSAYLLREAGYDVRCVFMKNWTGTHDDLAGECNWVRERDDAAAVARALRLPFTVWDFEREYRRLVISHFFAEYARGRTPNPDVRCNQYVKIPLFLKRALAEGADAIGTGHYARTRTLGGVCQLLNGRDANKDQSYFLYTMTQSQLRRTVFPVGELTKPEVRRIAARAKLPVAEKKDSVGICFVGEVAIEDFLRTQLPERPGTIVDTRGRTLGQHRGLAFYTLGQRHRLGLSGGPWYVVGRAWRKNVLVVGGLRDQRMLMVREFTARAAHWVSGTAPALPGALLLRHRYRARLVPARISLGPGGRLHVRCRAAQRAVTPGQSAVFYQRTGRSVQVVGGAIIDKLVEPAVAW